MLHAYEMFLSSKRSLHKADCAGFIVKRYDHSPETFTFFSTIGTLYFKLRIQCLHYTASIIVKLTVVKAMCRSVYSLGSAPLLIYTVSQKKRSQFEML